MLTAQKKKKENIAEYILYMWQVEDLIRAYDCNMERIRTELLPQYGQSGEILQEMEQWWDNLCAMLKVEQKEKSGHLQMLTNTVNELNTLHHLLLKTPKFVNYQIQFQQLQPLLKELETKTSPSPANDIELMLSALYNTFLLRLQKQSLSAETLSAMKQFASFLALLSKRYQEEQTGKLDLED